MNDLDMATNQGGPANAAPPPPYPVALPPRPLKVHLPEPFEGNRAHLKQFLMQMELYFGFNIDRFPDHETKVLFVVSYLKGKAYQWIAPLLEDFLENAATPDNREEATTVMFGNYAYFKLEITRIYGDVDLACNAERSIMSLRQTTSAAVYAAEFQQYSPQTEWDDVALTAQFYKGLKDSVKDDIARTE